MVIDLNTPLDQARCTSLKFSAPRLNFFLAVISFVPAPLLVQVDKSMAKCPHSPIVAPPPKCSRKPTGFRVARPPPNNSQSSFSSIFVTVSQPDE